MIWAFLSPPCQKELKLAVPEKFHCMGLGVNSVTRCKESTEWHSIFPLVLSEHLETLGVAQCLASLQRPVMVIFTQSALSMGVWVSGLIRT